MHWILISHFPVGREGEKSLSYVNTEDLNEVKVEAVSYYVESRLTLEVISIVN